MCLDYQIIQITGFQIKKLNYLVKLFIKNVCQCILYINEDQKQQKYDYNLGLGQGVTEVYVLSTRESGPTDIIFHKNSFLLKVSKIIGLNL